MQTTSIIYDMHISFLNKLLHHLLKLLEVDLAVTVEINFLDDLGPYGLVGLKSIAHDCGDFLGVNRATAISVEELKRGF